MSEKLSGIPAEALQNLLDLVTPPEEIKWREGPRGKQLAYIDARYVMRVLDTLIGPANWQCDFKPGAGGITLGGIGIKIDGEWVWKWDGAGETDIEGEKGAVSDAFKRAAVRWGIARDLYSIRPTDSSADHRPIVAQNTTPAAPQSSPLPLRNPPPLGDDLTAGMDEEGRGDCPVHHVAFRHVPAGVSKRTGKSYNAFWSCPEMGCKERPPHREHADGG